MSVKAHSVSIRALATAGMLALLAACGGQAPSGNAGTSGLSGEFISGVVSRPQTWVALSTDGHRVIAFACDGSVARPPTFAEWFTGTGSSGIIDLRSSDGARLVTSLTKRSTTGRVVLSNGTDVDFTLTPIRAQGQAGLFRSEQTVNGVAYLAGWVLPPQAPASSPPPASPPPASPLSQASPPSTATPASRTSPTSPAGRASPARPAIRVASVSPEPATPGSRRRVASPTPAPKPVQSSSPSLPAQGGAIVDEESGGLLPPPELDPRALAMRQVEVPKVGTLTVMYCVQARCE